MPAATATLSDSAPGASGMRDSPPRRRGQRGADARALRCPPPARAAGRRLSRGRAGSPSAVGQPRAPDAARAGPGSRNPRRRSRRPGSRKSAPMLPRSTFGLVSSAVPLSATTPAAPRPSAVRSMVPTFPGSCTPSRTSTTLPGGRPTCRPATRRGARSRRRPPADARCRPGRRARGRHLARAACPAPPSALLRAAPRVVPSSAGDTAAPARPVRRRRAPPRPAARLPRAPARGARGPGAGARSRISVVSSEPPWRCSPDEDRAHHRRLRLRRRRRHPGRPQDLPAVRRLRHDGHRRRSPRRTPVGVRAVQTVPTAMVAAQLDARWPRTCRPRRSRPACWRPPALVRLGGRGDPRERMAATTCSTRSWSRPRAHRLLDADAEDGDAGHACFRSPPW